MAIENLPADKDEVFMYSGHQHIPETTKRIAAQISDPCFFALYKKII